MSGLIKLRTYLLFTIIEHVITKAVDATITKKMLFEYTEMGQDVKHEWTITRNGTKYPFTIRF